MGSNMPSGKRELYASIELFQVFKWEQSCFLTVPAGTFTHVKYFGFQPSCVTLNWVGVWHAGYSR